MEKLYCPECGEYLEGGTGEMMDCTCGWKQTRRKKTCGNCEAFITEECDYDGTEHWEDDDGCYNHDFKD